MLSPTVLGMSELMSVGSGPDGSDAVGILCSAISQKVKRVKKSCLLELKLLRREWKKRGPCGSLHLDLRKLRREHTLDVARARGYLE